MSEPFYDRFGKRYYPDEGMAFPRRAVYGIVYLDGRVLLTALPRCDLFEFPGGGVDRGESLREALSREMYEESGYVLEAGAPRQQIEQTVNFFADDIRPSGEYWIYEQTFQVFDGDKYGLVLRDDVWRTPENGRAKWVLIEDLLNGRTEINYCHRLALEKVKWPA